MKSWSDKAIVSYLDGLLNPQHCRELETQMINDPKLAARVKALSIDTAAIREAFDNSLVQAPEFSVPTNVPVKPALRPTQQKSFTRLLPLAAGVLVALGLGVLTGMNLQLNNPSSTVTAWQQAVVDYQVLYVPRTLPAQAPTLASKQRQLAAVSESSGFAVTDDMVALPGIQFRRAQTLGLNGAPLIQIAFADHDGQPVALCFTPVSAPASEPVAQVIDGMNTVSWRNGEYGFIIVGFTDAQALSNAAEKAITLFTNG